MENRWTREKLRSWSMKRWIVRIICSKYPMYSQWKIWSDKGASALGINTVLWLKVTVTGTWTDNSYWCAYHMILCSASLWIFLTCSAISQKSVTISMGWWQKTAAPPTSPLMTSKQTYSTRHQTSWIFQHYLMGRIYHHPGVRLKKFMATLHMQRQSDITCPLLCELVVNLQLTIMSNK